ncbi:MAG: beta-propeller fold lactonase family protein [Gammaproteobacteria bacterium]|nr:beta-propeller fold lactonase family protein [Gammaproteobacteria bacterium]
MKRQKNSVVFITGMLLLGSSIAYAAQATFSIIPVAGTVTSLLLPSNFTETVSYQVTNQTKVTRTLTMTPMAGVTQVTGNGSCPNPFTLSSKQSCTLTLVINGSQVPASGISGGPVICKIKGPSDPSPDPFLCSRPDVGSTLAVSVTSTGQHVYIANQLGNSVSFCQANPATSALSQCAITATGLGGVEGIGFNPSGNLFYSANPLTNSISVCQVNKQTGALSGCIDAGGAGFNLPNAIAFSPDGSILYTANLGGAQSVSACLVNATTGLLSSCINNTSPTFGAPSDMTINAAGTLAYVVNRSNSTTSVCNVFGQVVTSCNDLSGSLFNEPEGVILSPLGLHAYISNAGDKKVIACDVRQDGTGLLDNCSATRGQFDGTGNVGLNSLGSVAYVPNELLSTVFVCDVSGVSGALSDCRPSGGTGFFGPAGIVLN